MEVEEGPAAGGFFGERVRLFVARNTAVAGYPK